MSLYTPLRPADTLKATHGVFMIALLLMSMLTSAQTPTPPKVDAKTKVIYCHFGSLDLVNGHKFQYFEVRDQVQYLVTKEGKISSLKVAREGKSGDQLKEFLGFSALAITLKDDQIAVYLNDFVDTPKGVKLREVTNVVAAAGTFYQTFHPHKFNLFCMLTPVK